MGYNDVIKVEVLDYLDGDVAGIKSVTMLIKGDNVYGETRERGAGIRPNVG